MRLINTRDTVAMARIIKACGLKDEVIRYEEKGYKINADARAIKDEAERAEFIEKNKNILGIDFALTVLFEATESTKTESDLYALIAGIVETDKNGDPCTSETIATMPIEELIDVVKEISKENNGLVGFFKNALQLTKKF